MGEREGMTALRSHSDPVSKAIGSSLRRMLRVVLFSGLVNLLTLSGSIYMLQVYDRVIPSRDGGTLAGLSVIVLLAYVLQGFLDALRSRLLCRIAAQFDVELQGPLYRALAGLPLTGARPAELGLWYDDAWDRSLFAPGSAVPGVETNFSESLDWDSYFAGATPVRCSSCRCLSSASQ